MATIQVQPPLLYAAGAIWPVVCTVVVGARFATRHKLGIRLGADDWLTVPALVMVIGMCAGLLASVAMRGVGYPTDFPQVQSPEQLFTATSYVFTVSHKTYWAMLLVNTPCLGLLKLSCLIFYRRIFRSGVNKWTDGFLVFMMVTVVIWSIGMAFGFMFICGTNFDWLWTTIANSALCGNSVALNEALAVSDVIQDGIIFLFPLPFVWRLHMASSHKMAVTGVFLLGAFAIAASVVRMVMLEQAVSVEFAGLVDPSYLSTGAIYFMINEAGFALCTICLPTLSSSAKIPRVRSFFDDISNIFSLGSVSRSSQPQSQDVELGKLPSSEHSREYIERPSAAYGRSEVRTTTTITHSHHDT